MLIVNINSNEPLFYPDSVTANKCSGSCNDICRPYSQLFVPIDVKDMNVEVFNQMKHVICHGMTLKCVNIVRFKRLQ